MGANASVTVDYGQNRSNLGRYLNGNTVYQHERGTADFALKGHQMGGTPHFWMARLDIGRADLDIPKSWNAFIDYKYFEHGSPSLVAMVLAQYRIGASRRYTQLYI
ncbi:MAG: putative porin [Veillonella sp.]